MGKPPMNEPIPVFLFGMDRSGTTLMSMMVGRFRTKVWDSLGEEPPPEPTGGRGRKKKPKKGKKKHEEKGKAASDGEVQARDDEKVEEIKKEIMDNRDFDHPANFSLHQYEEI